MNALTQPAFRIALASDEDELRAAQALRYRIFAKELGAAGPGVDHSAGLERDRFDPYCDHMLLYDDAIGEVVGVYRLIRDDHARAAGGFYSESEYDLQPLKSAGRSLMELGRSCLRAEYRGGAAMYHLWNGLAQYVGEHGVDVLFGVASFKGTDAQALAAPLSLLHHKHLAPEDIRPVVRKPHGVAMDLMAEDQIDRRRTMLDIPALIKGYLRLGGQVGQGAWIDHAFNTTDICLVLDTAALSARQQQIYSGRI